MKYAIQLLFCSVLILSHQVCAQIPNLTSKLAEEEQSVTISQLSIDVDIVGNIATTTFDLTFYNPNDRVLEGELTVPLNEGEDISRYALEVNGVLREGVIVEKVKARQTYEAVVRQNIDPGLASKSKGNFFKTRVYPIPAKSYKRMVVATVQTLPPDPLGYAYTIPVDEPLRLTKFELLVKVYRGNDFEAKPRSKVENMSFDTQDNVHYLAFKRENYALVKSLKFTIPNFNKHIPQLFTESIDGQTYFYLTTRPPEFESKPQVPPQSIAIYWDQSLSGSKRLIDKELVLLSQYLKSIPGRKTVDLVGFNYQFFEPEKFEIEQDTDELIESILALRYDGATRFDQLSFDHPADLTIIITDGVPTIGDPSFGQLNQAACLISSGFQSNFQFLRKTAAQTQGKYLNLNTSSIDQALLRLRQLEVKLIAIDADRGLSEVYPLMPAELDGQVEVVGKLKADSSSLTLIFGTTDHVIQQSSFQIKTAREAPVSRIWASKKIESLDWENAEHKPQILELSRKYRIVTGNTSLLVLDRIEDYVAHEIVPPMEMKAAYDSLIQLKPKTTKSQDEIQQANLAYFENLVGWYRDPLLKDVEKKIIGTDDMMEIIDEVEIELDAEVFNETVIEDVVFNMMPAEEIYELADRNEPFERAAQSGSAIKVLSWLPDAPYMAEVRAANNQDFFKVYDQLKVDHAQRPAFYIQVADHLFQRGEKEHATQVLSNVIELDLENPELLKVVARRLQDEGLIELSIAIHQEIKDLRPEEPQSYRDLGHAYEAAGNHQLALGMYAYILDNDWGRFNEIKTVIFNEMNHLIATNEFIDTSKMNPEFIHQMSVDIRIVIDWSSNENDIDLWVVDPNGEKCFYSNPTTQLGGKISADFTRGYGPEEFVQKTAQRGTYTIYANYFSEARQRIIGPVTVYARIFTNYGTPQEKSQYTAIQLVDSKETIQLGQLEFDE